MNIEDKYYKLLDKEYHLRLALAKLKEASRHISEAQDDSLWLELDYVMESTDRNIKFLREQSDKLREELTR